MNVHIQTTRIPFLVEKRTMYKKPIFHFLHLIPMIAAGITSVLGIVVLTGWYIKEMSLIQILPLFVPMQVNTAIGFLICSMGIFMQLVRRKQLTMILGFTAATVAFLTLLQYIFDVNLGIDQLLMEHYITVETSHPGRMAPNTALCFGLSGVALMFLGKTKQDRYDTMMIGVLGLVVAALGVVSFLGYLSGVEPAYGWGNFTRMAIHTSLGFFVLGAGIFTLAWILETATGSKIPNWIEIPVGIALIMIAITEWQALNTELSVKDSHLPIYALITGFIMSVAVIISLRFALIAYKRAKEVESINRQLKSAITERRNVEEELSNCEVKHRSTIDNLMEGFYSATLDGTLLEHNTEFNKILGFNPHKNLKGTPLPDFWQDPQDRVDYLNQLKKDGFIKNYEVKAQTSRKEKIVVLANSRLIIYEDDNKSRIEGSFIDITQRKLAEEELKEAHDRLEQKVAERTAKLQYEIDERRQIEEHLMEAKKEADMANRAKTEFLSNISHEFRTPMHQILSYAKFGVDKIDKVNKEKLYHYFSKIETIGHNLLMLLNDMLDLSKLESGKTEYTMQTRDLKCIVRNVFGEFVSLIDEKGVTVNMMKNDPPVTIVCDEPKIGQVVRNILSNAIKFTPTGKTISISTTSAELPGGQAGVRLNVCDEGVGIPPEELESVFDKFIQSNKTKTVEGGTGLGLAICREIIHGHHGEIWAENNPKCGATFSFIIPVDQSGV